MQRDEIPTPALVLDLPAFETNVARMAATWRRTARRCARTARPTSVPKSPGGWWPPAPSAPAPPSSARPRCSPTHGMRGLLVTTAVVGPAKAARAAALARAGARHDLRRRRRRRGARAGRRRVARRASPLRVAVDLYFGRTGVPPGEPARDIARAIDRSPSLAFAGLQAYDGTASHTSPLRRAARPQHRQHAGGRRHGRLIDRRRHSLSAGHRRLDRHLPHRRRASTASPSCSPAASSSWTPTTRGSAAPTAARRTPTSCTALIGGHHRGERARRRGHRRRRLQVVRHRPAVHAGADRPAGPDLRVGRRRARPARPAAGARGACRSATAWRCSRRTATPP